MYISGKHTTHNISVLIFYSVNSKFNLGALEYPITGIYVKIKIILKFRHFVTRSKTESKVREITTKRCDFCDFPPRLLNLS